MTESPAEERLRTTEQAFATHEGVCAERYKGITEKLASLHGDVRNLVLAMLALTAASVASNPLVAVLQHLTGR
jgi:hypothetical protein